MPLRLKLMLPVMAVCTLLVLVLFFTVWAYGTRSLENRLRGDADLLAHVVHSATKAVPSRNELTRVLETIQEDPSVNFVIAVENRTGRVIAASDPYTAKHANQVIPFWHELKKRLPPASGNEVPWFNFSKYQLQHISRNFSGEQEAFDKGYFILLALDTSKARTEVFAAAQGVAIAALAALLTLSVAVAALLQGIVIRRVRKIIRSTPKSRQELQKFENPLRGQDELCRLANSMSSAYRQLADSLIRQDEPAEEAPSPPTPHVSGREAASGRKLRVDSNQLIGKARIAGARKSTRPAGRSLPKRRRHSSFS